MKTVLVTGGSRGIGAAIVEKFLSEGYKTAFFYKSSDALAEKIKNKYENALPVKCDVTDSESVRLSVLEVSRALGDIDILVNNAGVAFGGLLQDMTDEEWGSVLNTNLTSTFYLSREVIPSMVRNKSGVIINISSMWGITGASCEVAYSAAKAGVIGFTKALAKELAPSGVRVVAVAPGAVMTDMMKAYDEETLLQIADETPLGRIGKPEEIAEAVYFLASDKASFVCGDVLNVNGGFVI